MEMEVLEYRLAGLLGQLTAARAVLYALLDAHPNKGVVETSLDRLDNLTASCSPITNQALQAELAMYRRWLQPAGG